MDKGIKPTRLWHLTGKLHFRKMIQDRIMARPPFEQRGKKDILQVMAITLVSTLGIASTYGAFTKQKTPTTIIRGTCDTGKKATKPKCSPPKEPCPPKNDPPMKPCSSE